MEIWIWQSLFSRKKYENKFNSIFFSDIDTETIHEHLAEIGEKFANIWHSSKTLN